MCLAKLHWQCSRAAHATAGCPAYPGCAQRQRVSCRHGTAVQMGDLLFRDRRVLEPGRRGHLRIYDQSADRPLLYARTQYYRCACPRSAVWRLGHARLGVDALLLACDAAGSALAGTLAQVRVLGDQHRHDDGDPAEPTADWPVADVSVGLRRILVGAQPGVYADRHHAVSAVDADGRRHSFRYRRGGLWLFRSEVDLSASNDRKTHRTSGMASQSPRSAMIVQPTT